MMTKRKKPKVNMGIHLGASAGANNQPLEDAEKRFREMEDRTPQDIADFRRGYVLGQINARIRFLQDWQASLNREELEQMLSDLAPIAEKWGYGDE